MSLRAERNENRASLLNFEFFFVVYLVPMVMVVMMMVLVVEGNTTVGGNIQCEKYDSSNCPSGNIEACTSVEVCSIESAHDRPNNCFVLWKEDPPGNITVSLKGCFTQNQACNQSECVDTNFEAKQKNIRFCCCYGSLCNREHRWQPLTTEKPEEIEKEPQQNGRDGMLIYILVIVSIVTVIVCIGTTGFYFKNRRANFNQIPTNDPESGPNSSAELELMAIKLLEVKARGRFGTVWKAQMQPEEVAVKIFPMQDQQSWHTEQEIFKLPRMKHPNILQFIGAGKKGPEDSGEASLWLVTSYHPNGSLCDYLKSHTVTWKEMCKIAESMARGLMHLHEEIAANKIDGTKPSIAHRDFKSKNVLLKNDLTACIADFGLALIFQPGQSCGDTHGQVGTRRYMAPEILEGAINFTRDAFLRIDVYACGLVLWELVSRCTAHGEFVGDYRLPFEEELDTHPTLEQMQDFVVSKKMRPRIQENWRKHTVSTNFCLFF